MAHFFQLENSEMAQNSKRNWIRGKNGSNFEPSQGSRAEKSEPTQSYDTCWIFRARIKEKLNNSNFEPSQRDMHMPSRAGLMISPHPIVYRL